MTESSTVATPGAVPRPTLRAIVQSAVDATGAERGWLLAADGEALVVAAASGDEAAARRVGQRRRPGGVAGFVLSSGQPAALQTRPGDTDNAGAGGADGSPRSILAAPCVAGQVLGVLEVVDAPGGSFSFDDVETVSLLADIAGAALSEAAPADAPPSPARLGEALSALAAADPHRYAEVARAIGVLL